MCAMRNEQQMSILEARFWLYRAADVNAFQTNPNTHAFCAQVAIELENAFPCLLRNKLELSETTVLSPVCDNEGKKQ